MPTTYEKAHMLLSSLDAAMQDVLTAAVAKEKALARVHPDTRLSDIPEFAAYERAVQRVRNIGREASALLVEGIDVANRPHDITINGMRLTHEQTRVLYGCFHHAARHNGVKWNPKGLEAVQVIESAFVRALH